MLNAQQAWTNIGLNFWALHIPDLVALEEQHPGRATARAYRQGFKEAVGVSNSYFLQLIKPEHRPN